MPLALTAAGPLTLTPNPLLAPPAGARTVAKIEEELRRLPHLGGDSRHTRREHKAAMIDARAAKTAAEAMEGRLPDVDEAIHIVISGRFALFDFVPAALAIAGCRVDALTIATLGFSTRNIDKLCALVDAGEIGSVRMLCSHYFAGTSSKIYDAAAEAFAARPDRMEFLSIRTHAKILLLAFADGRRLTMESSANLRSCKNLEQSSAFGSPDLYDFHRGWIDGLFAASKGAK